MNNTLKILLVVILLISLLSMGKIYKYLGLGQTETEELLVDIPDEAEIPEVSETETENHPVNDSLYRWSEQDLDWVPVEGTPQDQTEFFIRNNNESDEIAWEVLTEIHYQLRYFEQVEMEIFAPVFPKAVQELDGKEVVIKGYVIPFDEEVLSLSLNPYASCFFCGKASPASVLSLYPKNQRKAYKMDEFKKFRGTLHLNDSDPNEFYYILRNASEE